MWKRRPTPNSIPGNGRTLHLVGVCLNRIGKAYSYNVVEHVKEIDPFLRKTTEILKSGSCYWSMSPNYHHPFAKITRAIQRSGLVSIYRNLINRQANDYPAYYNLSRQENIIESIKRQKLPIKKIDFYYIPNVHWDNYFPRILRFIPYLMDRFWILKRYNRSFIFIFRMEKSENLNGWFDSCLSG